MTDRPAPRARWSRRAIRTLAWITGGVTFLVSGTVLARAPLPEDTQRIGPSEIGPSRIIRRIERRIIIGPPTVIGGGATGGTSAPSWTAPSGGGGTSGGSVGSTTTGGS